MATKRKSRSGGAALYEPTPAEMGKWAQLVAKLTPSPSVYEQYVRRVDSYLYMIGPALRTPEPGWLTAVRLRRSELFEGREYLIAYVEDKWLRGIAPGCDAIASAMVRRSAEDDSLVQAPPLVFLPVSARRARSEAFKAVVEHEIVHINQAILGTLPSAPSGRSADDLLALLFDRTRVEYEASFIQLVRWPFEYPADAGVTLEHWCLVRGYSQSLKDALVTVSQLDFPPREVNRFLDALSSSLVDRLRLVGASEELAAWFAPRLDTHLTLALKEVSTSLPPIMDHPGFRAAERWLRSRLGIAPGTRKNPLEDE